MRLRHIDLDHVRRAAVQSTSEGFVVTRAAGAVGMALVLCGATWAPVAAQDGGAATEDPGRVVSAKNYAPPTEADFLRFHLKLPKDAPLRVDGARTLPVSEPLKVYFAFEANDFYWADAYDRLNEWNAKDAKKLGRIEPVRSIADAQVVLVRMITVGVRPAKAPDAPGFDGTPAYGPDRSRWLMDKSAPVYLYVAERTPDGLVVLKRQADWSLMPRQPTKSTRIWEMLKSLMKARAKARRG
jgi:hypothetical protein